MFTQIKLVIMLVINTEKKVVLKAYLFCHGHVSFVVEVWGLP